MNAPYDRALDDAEAGTAVALRSPLPGREHERLYWYQVELEPIVGFVWAPDEDTARAAAADDAQSLASGYVERGTWRVTPIHAK